MAQATQGIDCGNSVYYDLKINPKIYWRSLLYLVAVRFRNLAGKLNPNLENNSRVFIFAKANSTSIREKANQPASMHKLPMPQSVWCNIPYCRFTNVSQIMVRLTVFASALEDAMKNRIPSELQKMFWIILEIFCNYAGVNIIEFTGSIFRDENAYIKLQQFNPALFDNLQKPRAA